MADLSVQLTDRRQRLQRRLASLYQMGGQGYVRLFLAVDPGSDPRVVIRQLRFLLRRDAGALRSYLEVRDRLDTEAQERSLRYREAEQWLQSTEERRQQLVHLRQEREELLVRVERERETLAVRTSALQDKEQRLASLIALLYNESAEVVTGTPIQQFRGVLDWPVRGEILVAFGPREDPRYGTQVPHNGIEIRTESGSDVRVVFSGRVRFAAPFEGFGYTAVVQHAEHVFTLYAGLSELSVTREDMLSLGDRVGVAGAALYFEVRVQSRPEDPLLWLR